MKENISKKVLREFGFLISFGFPIIIGWFIPAFGGHSFRIWTIWVSIISLILAIIKPPLLYYPYQIWMQLGNILGWINSRVILGLVFIFVLLPISLIMKMFGHDPLNTKKTGQKSYREIKIKDKVNFKKIF